MTPQEELEITKAALLFAVITSGESQELIRELSDRIMAVKTRPELNYLMSQLAVEVSDE